MLQLTIINLHVYIYIYVCVCVCVSVDLTVQILCTSPWNTKYGVCSPLTCPPVTCDLDNIADDDTSFEGSSQGDINPNNNTVKHKNSTPEVTPVLADGGVVKVLPGCRLNKTTSGKSHKDNTSQCVQVSPPPKVYTP